MRDKNVVVDVAELPVSEYEPASSLLYSSPFMHGTYSVTEIAYFRLALRLSLCDCSGHVSIPVCGSAAGSQ
jgi:hypothetical protein